MNTSPWVPRQPSPDASMGGTEAEVLALREEINRLKVELAGIKSMGPLALLRWWFRRASQP